MKKGIAIALVSTTLMSTALVPLGTARAANFSTSDYSTALKDAIWFYDANKCGKDVAVDNVFSWRGACHTTDGSKEGVDLTGGFHDCGDHIKFGITNGYAASILGWSLYEFKDAYEATGHKAKLLSTLKYFTDYIIRSRVSSTKWAYHVGSDSDHDYWGPPEKQPGDRDLVRYMSSGTASDVCGLYSGALSLMYLNYKDIDKEYADKCLEYSKELYQMGQGGGTCSAGSFYSSSSGDDDMAWAAAWLYVIEKKESYISFINSKLPSPATNWVICWNDMKNAVSMVIGREANLSKYKDAVSSNLDWVQNSVSSTSGGVKKISEWGNLRYVSAAAMLALIQYKSTNDEKLKTFAKSQIDYIMGSNPNGMSYIIGFGNKWPQYPHHRAAQGTQGWDNWKSPAKNVLTGALVGGPSSSDSYNDVVDDYKSSEVGIDYNAGLVAALAGINKYYGAPIPSSTPTQSIPPSNSSKPTQDPNFIREDINRDRSVNMQDVMMIASCFGNTAIDSKYDEKVDVNLDGSINMSDVVRLAMKFGYTY